MHMKRHGEFDLYHLSDPGELNGLAQSFAEAYCTIFSGAPYFEAHTPEHALARFDSLVTIPDQISIVARRGKDLAGFAITVPLVSQPVVAQELSGLLPVSHTYYLAELGVLPTHRGAGLGRSLVQERIRRMDTSRYSHVVLRVAASRNASYEMYRAMGFDDMGVTMSVSTQRIDGEVRSDRRLFLSRMISQVDL